MKHLTRLAVLLITLLLLSPPARAELTIPFPQNQRHGFDCTYDIACLNGDVYIKNHSGLFRYRPGMDQPAMVFLTSNQDSAYPPELPFFDRLVAGDGQLYAFQSIHQQIARLPSGMEEGQLQPWIDLNAGEAPAARRPLAVRNQRLYSLLGRGGGEADRLLWICDLDSGDRQTLAIPGLMDAALYSDTRLLILCREEKGGEQAALCLFDIQSQEKTPLGTQRFPAAQHLALACDEARGRVFVISQTRILMLSDQGETLWETANPCQSGMEADMPTNLALVNDDGALVLNALATMTLLTPGESADKPALYVYGVSPDDPRHARAAAMTPGVTVFISPLAYGEHALSPALVSGSHQIDAFVLQAERFDLPHMAKKGWLLPLDGFPEIRRRADALYPLARDAVCRDGALFALPLSLKLSCFLANRQAFDSLGLPLPDSFEALCRTVDICQESGDIVPYMADDMPDASFRRDLINKAHQFYIDYLVGKGERVTYDTPLFRRLVTAATAVRQAPLPVYPEMNGRALGLVQLLDDPRGGYSLITRTADLDDEDNAFMPLPLLLDGEAAAAPVLSATVGAVNAQSGLKEAAARYIQAYFDTAPDEARLLMVQEGAKPVPSPAHAEKTLKINRSLQGLLKKKEEGKLPEGKSMAELEEEIRLLEEALISERGKYLISAAALKEYQQLLDAAQLYDYASQSLVCNSNIQTLFERFLAGQIGLEQYIREAGGVLQLMQRESDQD